MDDRLSRLQALFEVILEEARRNAAFALRLDGALAKPTLASHIGEELTKQLSSTRKGNRRGKAALDPFELFATGEEHLRGSLETLDLEQLKDVVAEYGMDRSRLALKWKASKRLIDLIIDTVKSRASKGDAFKAPSSTPERRNEAKDKAVSPARKDAGQVERDDSEPRTRDT